MKDSRFALMVTVPVAIFLIAWVIYPITYSFWLSLQHFHVVKGALTPGFVGLANYIQAVQDPAVQGAFIVSLEVDVGGIAMTVAMALAIALTLNEVLPISGFWKVICLLPWAISDFGTGVAWRWIWTGGFGFFNGIL